MTFPGPQRSGQRLQLSVSPSPPWRQQLSQSCRNASRARALSHIMQSSSRNWSYANLALPHLETGISFGDLATALPHGAFNGLNLAFRYSNLALFVPASQRPGRNTNEKHTNRITRGCFVLSFGQRRKRFLFVNEFLRQFLTAHIGI
ncbi:UNVERIFIED_CONTAM: hypothetical protein GTU68_059216 [Idotea baltica]|nr:hypothetical protein [Idotea baltica]